MEKSILVNIYIDSSHISTAPINKNAKKVKIEISNGDETMELKIWTELTGKHSDYIGYCLHYNSYLNILD